MISQEFQPAVNRTQPLSFSISNTLRTDWPALAAAIAIPVFWLIHFTFPYLRPQSEGSPPVAIAASATVLFAALLTWRLRRVARLFAKGSAAPGRVTRIAIARDRGRLEFEFEHEGQLVNSWTPIHKSKAVLKLCPGETVDVLFDPDEPTTAIVKHLYQA